MEMTMDQSCPEWRAPVRRLNDQFRCFGHGQGSLLVTAGVDGLGKSFVASAVAGLRQFDTFDQDNDPHREYDFGAFALQSHRLLFKIDYFDRSLSRHADDPADPMQTHRVLTLMLASEY